MKPGATSEFAYFEKGRELEGGPVLELGREDRVPARK